MCMEDIAIARATKTNMYFTTTEANIPGNPNRLSIRLTCEDSDAAELRTAAGQLVGGAPDAPVILGYASRFLIDTVVDRNVISPPDEVTLERVGNVLTGQLVLSSLRTIGVYAIETYIDVNDPSLAAYQPKGY